MTNKLLKKQATRNQINWMLALTILAASILLFWFWYNQSYLKPSNVFWGTINNNLTVDFVTRTGTKSEGEQKLTQITDIQYSPELIARSVVKLENTKTNEKVVTETIGTKTTDYLRYAEITSNNSANADKSAVGKWAKRDAAKGEQPQILSDALLGSVLMFGDLSSSQRQQLIGQLQTNNSFKKYDLLDKKTVNGQNIYTFNVSIDLDSYSKVYSDYLKMIGQDKLAEEIGQQKSGGTYDFILDINAGSRVPKRLSVSGSGDSESFSNVGAGPRLTAPDAKMSIAELQAKLSGQ